MPLRIDPWSIEQRFSEMFPVPRSGNNAQLIAFLTEQEQGHLMWRPVMFKVTAAEGFTWLASPDLPRTHRDYGGI